MVSRLVGTRAYLIGSIDRTADSGHGWRNALIPYLEDLGVTVFNPLNKPIDIGLEHDDARAARDKYKKAQDWDALADIMKKVRCVDLRMVDVCDFIVACLDLSEHPCGTYEELFWANREKKPILVYCKQGKAQMPDWLFGAIPHQHMFDTWADLKLYLNHVAYDKEYEHYKRWFLFNNLAVAQPKFKSEFDSYREKLLTVLSKKDVDELLGPDLTGLYSSAIQEVNVSVELGRTPVLELGRQAPYHKLPETTTVESADGYPEYIVHPKVLKELVSIEVPPGTKREDIHELGVKNNTLVKFRLDEILEE